MPGHATRSLFGRLSDGRDVEAIELSLETGFSVRLIAYGAAIQSLMAPDRDGRFADVVFGYETAEEYEAKPQYFGATIGRYANRIAAGRFTLDGETVALETNNGANHLHGGSQGFDKRLWEIASVEEGETPSVTFRRTSPDGEGAYPGTLEATVTYRLTAGNRLEVAYEATSDRVTIVNLTNHSFFNLAGALSGASALDHHLEIAAARFLPVDAGAIPTGEIRNVTGTPFDFRFPRAVAERLREGTDDQILLGRGYDHDYLLDDGETAEPTFAARLVDPASGRALTLSTTEPGLQLYSGNFLDATTAGKGGRVHRQGDAICLEPQRHPDTPNRPEFPSARLAPGEVYRHVSVYDFTPVPEE